MRDRAIWLAVALVLAAMSVSLWSDAFVAALGAGAAAVYCAVAAIRGRCFGDVCSMPPMIAEPEPTAMEDRRE